MTAKNKELIENLLLLREAKRLQLANFLTVDDIHRIKAQLPLPRTSSKLLVRLGFFFLGCTLLSSILGAVSVLLLGNEVNPTALLLVFAAIAITCAEILSHNDFHNFGLDDAFVLSFQILLAGAVFVTTESPTLVFFMLWIVGLACSYRYFNTASMFLSLMGISSFIASVITVHKLLHPMVLPFLMLLAAAMMYYGYVRLNALEPIRLYRGSMRMLKGFALVLGYLSVNYLIVRNLSEEMMKIVIQPGEDIPLAFIFYVTTFLIPAFYITYGVLKRDKIFILTGIAALAFSFISIRVYYHLLPLESALIFGGIALFAGGYYAMTKLRDKTSGLTFLADRYRDDDRSLTEAIVASSTLTPNTSQAGEDPMDFGGGTFSGGGSSSNY